MKKGFSVSISFCLLLSCAIAYAGEMTELSRNASKLKLKTTRQEVINLLGNPTWAVIPGDKGEFAITESDVKLVLYWRNNGCNPIVVSFNQNMKIIGWDEGRAYCGKDVHVFEPTDIYSCKKSDRIEFCSKGAYEVLWFSNKAHETTNIIWRVI